MSGSAPAAPAAPAARGAPAGLPLAACDAAVRAMWASGWAGDAAVPVLWGANENRELPDPAKVPDWLHLVVEFSGEAPIAFGRGRGSVEREMTGRVQLSVMSRRGTGETRNLRLLDLGLHAFRGRRAGPLTMLGDAPFADPEPAPEGAWWVRQATVPFVFRFRA